MFSASFTKLFYTSLSEQKLVVLDCLSSLVSISACFPLTFVCEEVMSAFSSLSNLLSNTIYSSLWSGKLYSFESHLH